LPVNDAQRYRMNAAECILAGERCGAAYRDLTFALAQSWLSLARQQEAMDELLVIWSNARSGEQPALSKPRRYPLHLEPLDPARRADAALDKRPTSAASMARDHITPVAHSSAMVGAISEAG
jgi:hypothetical protein